MTSENFYKINTPVHHEPAVKHIYTYFYLYVCIYLCIYIYIYIYVYIYIYIDLKGTI